MAWAADRVCARAPLPILAYCSKTGKRLRSQVARANRSVARSICNFAFSILQRRYFSAPLNSSSVETCNSKQRFIPPCLAVICGRHELTAERPQPSTTNAESAKLLLLAKTPII